MDPNLPVEVPDPNELDRLVLALSALEPVLTVTTDILKRDLEARKRNTRLQRVLAGLITLDVIIGLGTGAVLLDLRSLSNTSHRTGVENHQILQDVQAATSAAAAQKSAANLQHIILCLENRMDIDTGKTTFTLSGCTQP